MRPRAVAVRAVFAVLFLELVQLPKQRPRFLEPILKVPLPRLEPRAQLPELELRVHVRVGGTLAHLHDELGVVLEDLRAGLKLPLHRSHRRRRLRNLLRAGVSARGFPSFSGGGALGRPTVFRGVALGGSTRAGSLARAGGFGVVGVFFLFVHHINFLGKGGVVAAGGCGLIGPSALERGSDGGERGLQRGHLLTPLALRRDEALARFLGEGGLRLEPPSQPLVFLLQFGGLVDERGGGFGVFLLLCGGEFSRGCLCGGDGVPDRRIEPLG